MKKIKQILVLIKMDEGEGGELVGKSCRKRILINIKINLAKMERGGVKPLISFLWINVIFTELAPRPIQSLLV